MSPTPIDDAVLNRVLAEYPMNGLRVLEVFEASTRNDNFLIVDVTGTRYVLRRFRRNPVVNRADFQIRFQQHLYSRGFPTSAVIETKTDRGLVVAFGTPWALFTYVEGDEYDFSRIKQVTEAGQRLGEFHAVAETFPGEEVVVPFNPPLRDWWTNWEDDLKSLERMFVSAAAEEMAYLKDWWRRFARDWPLDRLDGLPVGWVHGDYHGRNMVFVQDEMRGLFDFDPVNRGPLIFDVAHGIFMFGREARGATRIRPEVAKAFLDAYAGVRPVAAEERAAIPAMLPFGWMPQARWYVHMERDGVDIHGLLHRDIGRMMAV